MLDLAAECFPLREVLPCGIRKRFGPTLANWDTPAGSELLEYLQRFVELGIAESHAGCPDSEKRSGDLCPAAEAQFEG